MVLPSRTFAKSVAANLVYWLERVAQSGTEMSRVLYCERDNMLRAAQFGLELEETRAAAIQLALDVFPLVERHGCWREWIPLLRQSIAAVPADDTLSALSLLDLLGQYQRLDRDFEAALQTHRRELQLAETLGDPLWRARAELDLCKVTWRLRDYASAETYGRSALAVFADSEGEIERVGATTTMLGLIAYGRGDMPEAITRLQRSVTIYCELQQTALLARALMNLALAEEAADESESALLHYEEAQALLEPTSFELDKVRVELALGTLYLNGGRFADAEAAFQRADSEFLRRSGLAYYQALTANNQGNLYYETGRLQKAESALRRSMDLWQRAGGRLMLGNTTGTLGQTLLAAGRPQEALALLEQALAITASYPDDRWAQELHGVFAAARDQVLSACAA